MSSEEARANATTSKGGKRRPAKDRTLSRAAERNYRVHALLGLAVKQGYGPSDLMAVATKGWKCSPTTAARLVAEAYDLCISATNLYDRQRVGAIQVSRMENLLRAALQKGNYQTALGVISEMNRFILSVDKFEREQQKKGDGGAGATPLTSEQEEALDREGDF